MRSPRVRLVAEAGTCVAAGALSDTPELPPTHFNGELLVREIEDALDYFLSAVGVVDRVFGEPYVLNGCRAGPTVPPALAFHHDEVLVSVIFE